MKSGGLLRLLAYPAVRRATFLAGGEGKSETDWPEKESHCKPSATADRAAYPQPIAALIVKDRIGDANKLDVHVANGELRVDAVALEACA